MTALTPKTITDRDGMVVVVMSDEAGNEYDLPLTIFDVSTLVSGLYRVRADVMKQPPPDAPEVMLPINGIKIGDNATHQLLRIVTGEGFIKTIAWKKERTSPNYLRRFQ
jgi:hypothetical protein